MKKKVGFLFVFAIFLAENCFPQSQGEKLFKENTSKDAVQVLENEILNNRISDDTYNFLGLGYYQLGEYEKSVDAFERGIKARSANAKILSFNQGNSYFALKKFENAAESFGNSYKLDKEFFDALLNRANSYLMSDKLALAKNDYSEYLEKNPQAEQKDKIEKLILAINGEIERRKEEQKFLEEQNGAKWEFIDSSIMIDENLNENGVVWEKISDNANAAEIQNAQNGADWQKIDDAKIGKIQIAENKKNWEEIAAENAKFGENVENGEKNIQNSAEKYENGETKSAWREIPQKEIENENKIGEEKIQNENTAADKNENFENENSWQKVENDVPHPQKIAKEKNKNDSDLWENIFEENDSELEKLNIQSQKEFELWQKEREAEENRRLQEELLRKKALEEEEKKKRQEFLKEMMDAENERRQKLLENVQNSLQGNDSKNVGFGADDIIENNQEGELD